MADFQPHAGGSARQVNIAGDNYAPIFMGAPPAETGESTEIARRQVPYWRTVRDFLPVKQFTGRERELAQLREFCAGPGFYQWWQGAPWAGKSSLMASFMLDAGTDDIRTVGFFITADSLPRCDRATFAARVAEQLGALLGENSPETASPDPVSFLRDLLHRAAELMSAEGKVLALVVDGLDEDSSSASIAACLPRQPVPGLKVIVTSRHDPGHLPADVAADHPLRSCEVQPLSPSPQGQDDKLAATREITHALQNGGRLALDVLGLIAAGHGGFGREDLAELVTARPFELDQVLVGRFGRSLRRRVRFSRANGDPCEAYEFAHRTLGESVASAIGRRELARYRALIHAWAQEKWDARWPDDTPAYLLYTYPLLVRSEDDLPRLLALTSQPARQHRMRAVGDAMALAEVTTTLDAFTARPEIAPEPDATLLAVARLAACRDEVTRKLPPVPVNLPAVWALLGDLPRAEALVGRVRGKDQQDAAKALIRAAIGDCPPPDSVVTPPSGSAPEEPHPIAELIAAGDVDRATELARSAFDREQHLDPMVALVKALVRTEEPHRGWALVDTVSVKHRSRLRSAAIREAVRAGRVDLARQWAGWIRNPEQKGLLWAELVPHVCEAFGVDAAAAIPRKIKNAPHHRAMAEARVAVAVAAAGDRLRARAFAENAENTTAEIHGRGAEQWLVTVRGELVRAYSAIGDLDHAHDLTRIMNHSARARRALVEDVAPAARAAEDTARVDEILKFVGGDSTELDTKDLVPLARAAARNGDLPRAQEIIGDIRDLTVKRRALADLATDFARAGDRVGAAQLANAAEAADGSGAAPIHVRSQAVVRLALDIARPDATDSPYADAEAVARGIEDDHTRANALTDVARALAHHGYHARALAVAESITYPYYRALACLHLAAGGSAPAALTAAEDSIHTIPDDRWRVTALCRLIAAGPRRRRAVDRHFRTGRDLAGRIPEERHRFDAWAELAEAAAGTGRRQDALALASRIDDPLRRTRALITAATAASAGGHARLADALADRAGHAGRRIREPEQRMRLRKEFVRLFVQLDRPRDADTTMAGLTADIRRIGDPALRTIAEADRVAATLARGDREHAESLAGSIEDPYTRAQALSTLIRYSAKAHRFEEAQRLRGLTTPQRLTDALLTLALEFTSALQLEEAERIALTITHAPVRAKAFAAIAVKHDHAATARRLTAEALLADWTNAIPALKTSPATAKLLIADYASGC